MMARVFSLLRDLNKDLVQRKKSRDRKTDDPFTIFLFLPNESFRFPKESLTIFSSLFRSITLPETIYIEKLYNDTHTHVRMFSDNNLINSRFSASKLIRGV